MKKRKETEARSRLTSTQEVLYQSEFKQADRAGGYIERKRK